jgi:oligopeptide transport system substrate-binding protein
MIEKKKVSLQKLPSCGTFFFRVNTHSPFLQDPVVRRTIASALDRKKLVDEMLSGSQVAAYGFLPPSVAVQLTPYFQDGLTPASLPWEKAPSLCLIYQEGERNRRIVQEVQQQLLKNLGLTVQLQVLEKKSYLERMRQGEYDLALSSWLGDYLDPLNFLEVFKGEQGGLNHTGWTHPHYIELLDQSLAQAPEKRASLFQQAEALLMEEMPIIPLFYLNLLYLKKENLQNVVLSPKGILDLKGAQWAEESRQ